MKYLIFIFVLLNVNAYSQYGSSNTKDKFVNELLDSLWVNPTSFFNNSDTNWRLLCSNLQQIDMQKLNKIINIKTNI